MLHPALWSASNSNEQRVVNGGALRSKSKAPRADLLAYLAQSPHPSPRIIHTQHAPSERVMGGEDWRERWMIGGGHELYGPKSNNLKKQDVS